MSVENRVKEIIMETINVNAEQVTPEAHLVEDLGADSLDVVQLIMNFEQEFKIEIPDEEAQKITTVGQAVAWITANAK